MNLKQHFEKIKTWEKPIIVNFFERLSDNVPIGMRIIIEREELSDQQKVDAMMWLNEFQHEVNKIRKDAPKWDESEEHLETVEAWVRVVAMRNDKIIHSEIAFCVRDAFDGIMRRKIKLNQ